MAQVVPHGPYAMGRVSIGAQWTAVAFGFLLSPLFVVFMVWFVGWLVYCCVIGHGIRTPFSG